MKARINSAGDAGVSSGALTMIEQPVASAAESSNVRLWDSRKRELMRATSVGFQCRSVQFSQDGQHLAVGGIADHRLGDVVFEELEPVPPLVDARDVAAVVGKPLGEGRAK